MTSFALNMTIAVVVVMNLACVLSQKKGEKGDPGVMGSPGQDGQDGIRGEKGEKGTIGPRGTKGKKGQTGPTGPRGKPGLPGLPGSSGLDGERGLKGDKGAKGTPGINGVRGIQGPAGATGNKGDIGSMGRKGDKGSVGPTGAKGNQGIAIKGDQGIQGFVGQKGDKGYNGSTGVKGDEGRLGQKGDKGDPGINTKGNRGLQGPIGPPGQVIKGQKGQKGSNGVQGIQGVRGSRGYTGPQGFRGYIGQKGEKGGLGDNGPKGAKGECQCTQAKCGVVGNWRLVAYLDTTTNGGSCPSGLREVSSDSRYGKRACGRSINPGCSSVTYTTSSYYSHICGRVRGYQYGTMDAFETSSGKSIDGVYVDGISITRGSPRQHVWTYAVGVSEKDDEVKFRCPCATNDYSRVPSFVGSNYYCESGFVGYREQRTAWEDTLWDGIRCDVASNKCCNRYGWFYRRVPHGNDYLEVRWCADQYGHGYEYGEDIYTDLVEIWVL